MLQSQGNSKSEIGESIQRLERIRGMDHRRKAFLFRINVERVLRFAKAGVDLQELVNDRWLGSWLLELLGQDGAMVDRFINSVDSAKMALAYAVGSDQVHIVQRTQELRQIDVSDCVLDDGMTMLDVATINMAKHTRSYLATYGLTHCPLLGSRSNLIMKLATLVFTFVQLISLSLDVTGFPPVFDDAISGIVSVFQLRTPAWGVHLPFWLFCWLNIPLLFFMMCVFRDEIKVLRRLPWLLSTIFFVPILRLLFSAFDCRHGELIMQPGELCWQGNHVLLLIGVPLFFVSFLCFAIRMALNDATWSNVRPFEDNMRQRLQDQLFCGANLGRELWGVIAYFAWPYTAPWFFLQGRQHDRRGTRRNELHWMLKDGGRVFDVAFMLIKVLLCAAPLAQDPLTILWIQCVLAVVLLVLVVWQRPYVHGKANRFLLTLVLGLVWMNGFALWIQSELEPSVQFVAAVLVFVGWIPWMVGVWWTSNRLAWLE